MPNLMLHPCFVPFLMTVYLVCNGHTIISAQARPLRAAPANLTPGYAYICVQGGSGSILGTVRKLASAKGASPSKVQVVESNKQIPIIKIGPIARNQVNTLTQQLEELGISSISESATAHPCDWSVNVSLPLPREDNITYYNVYDASYDSGAPYIEIPVSFQPIDLPRNKGYLVAIPARQEDLGQISEQIIQSRKFNVSRNNVRLRQFPKGFHVAVGLYESYDLAKAMELLLYSYGYKNARVYSP